MFRLLVNAFIFLFCFLASVSVFAASAEKPTQHLVSFLKAANTYQADFWQISQTSTGNAECAYGHLLLKQPGQLLWKIENISCQQVQAGKAPTDSNWNQVILAEQQTVKIYQPLLEQVIERSLKNLDDAVPVKLLTGASVNALSGFNISQKNQAGYDIFTLAPKSDQSLVSKVEIAFKNKQLQQMVVLTPLGQSTKLQFFNIKVNQALSNTVFKLKLPKGVDVVKQS